MKLRPKATKAVVGGIKHFWRQIKVELLNSLSVYLFVYLDVQKIILIAPLSSPLRLGSDACDGIQQIQS